MGVPEGLVSCHGGRVTAGVVPPGAQNQTLLRLLQALHVDSEPCLPNVLSRLCRDLGPGAFRLAARMYLQKGRCWWYLASAPGGHEGDRLSGPRFRVGFPIKEDFLEQSERIFGAKPVSLTGRNEIDLENINLWVKEATEGKIENFLSELPPDMVLLLLNAIHFQGAPSPPLSASLTCTCAPPALFPVCPCSLLGFPALFPALFRVPLPPLGQTTRLWRGRAFRGFESKRPTERFL